MMPMLKDLFFEWIFSQSPLAIWGAIVSTALGVIKIHETWQARHRIDIDFYMTSNSDDGHKITIRNLSGRQIIITHWELFLAKNKWTKNKDYISYSELGEGDRVIQANSPCVLSFPGEYHFAWSEKARRNKSIFITLYIAGRKPAIYRVFP